MPKRLALATMMALGLVAMFASAAQANKQLTVLKEGTPLTETTEIELTGPAKFSGGTGRDRFDPLPKTPYPANNTGTGTITEAVMDDEEAFGVIGHCTVEAEAVGLPWTVHAEETTGENPVKTFDITDPQFQKKLSGFLCPIELNITGGTANATPDNPNAISSVLMGGSIQTSAGVATASGTLDVVEPHTGVLGIG